MTTASAPLLQLDGFEGPMDVLLELVRQQRVDLGRISILALADQFIAAMMATTGRSVPLERQGEWLVIATWLVLLKSRLLLPGAGAEAEEAERNAEAELQRLEEQAMMRAAAAWLMGRPQLGHQVFARGVPPASIVPRAGFATFLEAGLTVFRETSVGQEDAVYRPVPLRLWHVVDAIDRMRILLDVLPGDSPLTAFFPEMTKGHPLLARSGIASTLMAGLELARGKILTLGQETPFGAITVRCSAAVADDSVPVT